MQNYGLERFDQVFIEYWKELTKMPVIKEKLLFEIQNILHSLY